MIGPAHMPAAWVAWNGLTGAPFQGPYAFFGFNCETRVWEYPWAFHVSGARAGQTAVDFGGSLSGFAITLSRAGLDVTVVDPDRDGQRPPLLLEGWSRQWGGELTSLRALPEAAGLPDAHFDLAFCLSVIEHIPTASERTRLLEAAHRCLRPGGRLVLTLDLALDLHPFTDRQERPGLRNVDVAELLGAAPFRLVWGQRDELYGMPGFDPVRVLERAHEGAYLVAHDGLVTQCLVLEAVHP